MPQSKGRNRLKIITIFKSYKYKNQTEARLLKRPSSEYYIKKDEIVSNHEFSATYELYKEVVTTFFQVVWENLLTGLRVPLPYNFGFLEIVKRKAARSVDWKSTAEQYGEENIGKPFKEMKKIYFDNSHTDGYSCRLRWRRENKNLKNRYAFNLQLTRKRKHELRDLINKDPDMIYRFNDI